MSLHIESTDEAIQQLKSQRNKTRAITLILTLVGLGSIGTILFLAKIFNFGPEEAQITAYVAPEGDDPTEERPEIQEQTSRPSSSSQSQVKVIASVDSSDVAIVNPEIDMEIPTDAIGSGLEIGMGFGSGTGDGGGGVPAIMEKRCDPSDRLKRILQSGGTEKCEEAVVKSLRWLAKQQNSDGSWGDQKYAASMTGIALLTFLAHCETPMSEEFGDNVLKGMTYLVNLGMKKPVVSNCAETAEVCYDHAVATYALCESFAFCKQLNIPAMEELEAVTTKAVDKILDAQCKNGAWSYRYDSGTHPDLSVVGWNVQALKAAEHAGIRPNKGNIHQAMRKAYNYTKKQSMPDGRFAYRENGQEARYSLTGVGLLTLQMTGNENDPATRKGYEWITNNANKIKWGSKGSIGNDPKQAFTSDNLYMHYYLAQAALNRGGDVWQKYNNAFRDTILAAQDNNGQFKINSDGGPGQNVYTARNNKNDQVYRQCLATLMLEVYYRFLPGTGGGLKK